MAGKKGCGGKKGVSGRKSKIAEVETADLLTIATGHLKSYLTDKDTKKSELIRVSLEVFKKLAVSKNEHDFKGIIVGLPQGKQADAFE